MSINILETDARQLLVILNTNPGQLVGPLICIRARFLCKQRCNIVNGALLKHLVQLYEVVRELLPFCQHMRQVMIRRSKSLQF